MSTELLKIEGGPLTTSQLKVTRFCCVKSVVDTNQASSRTSISLVINKPNNLNYEAINLTYNQAKILAETILNSIF
jgi:hypothetical protein